jgi:hypothetical protein
MELVNFRMDGTSLKHKSLFRGLHSQDIPAPGTGRFAFSGIDESAQRNDDQIFSLSLVAGDLQGGDDTNIPTVDADLHANDHFQQRLVGPRGPRLFNLFFRLSSRLGWSIQKRWGFACYGGTPSSDCVSVGCKLRNGNACTLYVDGESCRTDQPKANRLSPRRYSVRVQQ